MKFDRFARLFAPGLLFLLPVLVWARAPEFPKFEGWGVSPRAARQADGTFQPERGEEREYYYGLVRGIASQSVRDGRRPAEVRAACLAAAHLNRARLLENLLLEYAGDQSGQIVWSPNKTRSFTCDYQNGPRGRVVQCGGVLPPMETVWCQVQEQPTRENYGHCECLVALPVEGGAAALRANLRVRSR